MKVTIPKTEVSLHHFQFIYYRDDHVYLQFVPSRPLDYTVGDNVLEALNEWFGGISFDEVTGDGNIEQVSVKGSVTIDELRKYNYPIYDER